MAAHRLIFRRQIDRKQCARAAGVDEEDILILVKGPLLQQLKKTGQGLARVDRVRQDSLGPGQTAHSGAAAAAGDGIAGAEVIMDVDILRTRLDIAVQEPRGLPHQLQADLLEGVVAYPHAYRACAGQE